MSQQQQQQLTLRTDDMTPPSTVPTHTAPTTDIIQNHHQDQVLDIEMGIPTPPLTPHSPSISTIDVAANDEDALITPSTPTIIINSNSNSNSNPNNHKCDSPKVKAKVEGIHIPIPPTPTPTEEITYLSSLHVPLKAHLSFLHPSTPEEIIDFCAIRLLSKERPYGYTSSEEWIPLYLNSDDGGGVGFDLSTAGLGLEASPSICDHQNGPGKAAGERLEKMYRAVKESYRLLELRSPTRGSAL